VAGHEGDGVFPKPPLGNSRGPDRDTPTDVLSAEQVLGQTSVCCAMGTNAMTTSGAVDIGRISFLGDIAPERRAAHGNVVWSAYAFSAKSSVVSV
jgi:hypothetical protein